MSTIDHTVIHDPIAGRVECWRREGTEASASTAGAWLRFPRDNPDEFVPVVSKMHCGWEKESNCLACLALRAHRRMAKGAK